MQAAFYLYVTLRLNDKVGQALEALGTLQVRNRNCDDTSNLFYQTPKIL